MSKAVEFHSSANPIQQKSDHRLEAAIAALLLLGCAAILRVPRFIATALSNVAAPALVTSEASEFDRESHLRPPPRAQDTFA